MLFLLFLTYLSSVASQSTVPPNICLQRGVTSNPSATPLFFDESNIYSTNGLLTLTFNYYEWLDSDGNQNFCHATANNTIRNPVIHLYPGDTMILTLNNLVQPSANYSTATNLHFHGLAVTPLEPGDDIVHVQVESFGSFTYRLVIPNDHAPGLYWYHPHVYGLSEAAVLGGASGAIIIEGLEKVVPSIAGMPYSTLVVRGNTNPNFGSNTTIDGVVGGPTWFLSVGYFGIPVTMQVNTQTKYFLRLANNHGDAILNITIIYDNIPQPFSVIAVDGVVSSPMLTLNSYLLGPGNRIEFVMTSPSIFVRNASIVTWDIETGPFGDVDPFITLVNFAIPKTRLTPLLTMPSYVAPQITEFSESVIGLQSVQASVFRKLAFSEVLSNPADPSSPTNFYITVDGATPLLFDATNPPSIITNQGNIEEWVIENRAQELHVFHIHQVHFLVVALNGKPVVSNVVNDVYTVPFWNGVGAYPSVTLRMDFSAIDIGTFVYHCHILGHEDNGMMAMIQVLPPLEITPQGSSAPINADNLKLIISLSVCIPVLLLIILGLAYIYCRSCFFEKCLGESKNKDISFHDEGGHKFENSSNHNKNTTTYKQKKEVEFVAHVGSVRNESFDDPSIEQEQVMSFVVMDGEGREVTQTSKDHNEESSLIEVFFRTEESKQQEEQQVIV